MLNQIILVGRLAKDIKVERLDDNSKVATMTLAVPRSWKNEEGIYETDFIPIEIFGVVAENTSNYCHKGDVIGVKGRIENNNGVVIKGEKITFLSSKAGE